MKTLAKQIGIILILVPIVIGITAFSVEAQKDYNEYKIIAASCLKNGVLSEFDADYEVTIKGINGEELLVNTLRLSWIFTESLNEKDYIIFQYQTYASYLAGKEEWREEVVEIFGADWYDDPELGENTMDIFAIRENGGFFVFTSKVGVEKKNVSITKKENNIEYMISYVEIK